MGYLTINKRNHCKQGLLFFSLANMNKVIQLKWRDEMKLSIIKKISIGVLLCFPILMSCVSPAATDSKQFTEESVVGQSIAEESVSEEPIAEESIVLEPFENEFGEHGYEANLKAKGESKGIAVVDYQTPKSSTEANRNLVMSEVVMKILNSGYDVQYSVLEDIDQGMINQYVLVYKDSVFSYAQEYKSSPNESEWKYQYRLKAGETKQALNFLSAIKKLGEL
jgi:hypothetical protein